MSIGRRLKEYLTTRRLTQEEFSSLCKINKQTISNIIKEKTAPSGEVLLKIASEYEDLNFNWLIKGKGSMFSDIEELEEPGKIKFYATSLSNMQVLLNEKEKIISSQRETIDALKQVISSVQKEKG